MSEPLDVMELAADKIARRYIVGPKRLPAPHFEGHADGPAAVRVRPDAAAVIVLTHAGHPVSFRVVPRSAGSAVTHPVTQGFRP